MIAPILVFALAAAAQTGAPQTPAPAAKEALYPPLPVGASAEFFQTAAEIHALLEKKNFAEAGKRLSWLPNRNVTFSWEDQEVSIAARDAFADARDRAMGEWEKVFQGPTFKEEKNALVQFRFVKSLGIDATTGEPKAAAYLFRPGVSPRLECLIALQRGAKASPTTSMEVRNEVMYGISSYLGFATNPAFGSIGSRTDLPTNRPTVMTVVDYDVFKKIQAYGDALRSAVKRQDPWPMQRPQLVISPADATAPDTEESGRARFSFQISNTGSAPLSFRTIGDCGCVIPVPPATLAPGATVVINPQIDTTGFKELLDHRLILYTNDPEVPVRSLPIRVKVLPRFNWSDPNRGVLVMDAENATTKLSVEYATARNLDWNRARLDGIEGEIRYELSPKGDRTRAEVTLDINNPLPNGRRMVTLSIPSTTALGGLARYSFSVQRGIAVLPGDLYVGTLGGDAKEINFLVSRPGKPFRITKITSDLPYLKFTPTDLGKQEEYRVNVKYAGDAPTGEINGVITIETNDPRQPVLKMAVTGARV
jgi:hypothetical protein